MTKLSSSKQELLNVLNDLDKGAKLTIVGMNNFGFTQSLQTRFCSVGIARNDYQEYINLIHKPKNKRSYFILPSFYYKGMIILNGWIDIAIESQFKTYTEGNTVIRESINTAFDKTFLKDAALIWEKEILYSNVEI